MKFAFCFFSRPSPMSVPSFSSLPQRFFSCAVVIIFYLVSEFNGIQVECGGKKMRRETFIQTTPLLPMDNQLDIPSIPSQVWLFRGTLCLSVIKIRVCGIIRSSSARRVRKVMGSMLGPNSVIAKDVKSCTYCCYVKCATLIV